MNIALLLLHATFFVAPASKPTINTDSIRTIFADGQRAHVISAEMLDGKTVTLLQNPEGKLWLGDVSRNHKWFTTKNLTWSPKKKNCEMLVCEVSTLVCKCKDVVADSGFKFSRFMDDGTDGFQLIGENRVNGKFPKKTLPLDSFETRFKAEINKQVQP